MNHYDILTTLTEAHSDGYTVDRVYVDDEMYESLREGEFDIEDGVSGEKIGTVGGYEVYVDDDNPRVEASGDTESRTYPIESKDL